MKVLIACEYSGTVRNAMLARGYDAWSCDLLPSDDDSPRHITGDVLEILDDGWDLMIAHPPCTDLAVSGAAWFKNKKHTQPAAITFFRQFLLAPITYVAVENPRSIMSTRLRPRDQEVQPYQFGHLEQKATCFWLKNLPPLQPTNDVYDEMMKLPKKERERLHYMSPGPDRWKERSKTYSGIAEAMAEQWGGFVEDMLVNSKALW